MAQIAALIDRVLTNLGNASVEAAVRGEVQELTGRFPLYPERLNGSAEPAAHGNPVGGPGAPGEAQPKASRVDTEVGRGGASQAGAPPRSQSR